MSEITALDYQESIAAAVRAEFGRRKLIQSQLAAVIGRSRPTASTRWWGQTPYTAKELDQVAEFLGITPYYLSKSAEQARDLNPKDADPARITPARDIFAQPARAKRRAS